ncbi:3-isopropylmalate dehydratase small subunit [Rhodoplanes serenus]|uniref:3-isopropylmalate dehydratase n=1 Tax=Rhodoplanes serenus TaxID=200615 RepID=A0A9X4XPA0_9BRAD|nr:3-isopropylmalate dehydratase small subunit [Rhodoplanes serenus]MTW17189.1 3-isopropylmalate dehydratase small subunit [Rhodoplanes serenus]
MTPVRRVEGVAVALRRDNVDTDQLLPARFLKVPRQQGYGGFLLHDLRHDAEGRPVDGMPLNDPAHAGAKVLVARRAFGVGSSREAAVYALVDFGIGAVVAASFGDIFAANAANNGLITAEVAEADIEVLLAAVATEGTAVVDLESCMVTSGRLTAPFTIDPVRRTKLLNGWDDLDLTLSHHDAVTAFVAADRIARPWAQEIPEVSGR